MDENSTENVSDPDMSLTRKEKRALAKEKKKRGIEKEKQLSNFKTLLIWGVVLGILTWFLYKAYNFFTSPVPGVVSVPNEVYEDDWIRGDTEAGVALIKYEDFQCPACASYYPMIKELINKTPEGLKIVFRHYPLTGIHKNAFSAAKASEAAGRQGKFWEMHDILYEQQNDWANINDPEGKYSEYARQLELDEQMFSDDYNSDELSVKINNDIASGNRLGVNATPTFYLNGRFIQPRSYEEFKELVDNEIRGYVLE